MDHKYIRSNKNPGAVLNTDANSLISYKKRKKAFQDQKERIEKLENQMDSVLSLLHQIHDKLEKE